MTNKTKERNPQFSKEPRADGKWNLWRKQWVKDYPTNSPVWVIVGVFKKIPDWYKGKKT